MHKDKEDEIRNILPFSFLKLYRLTFDFLVGVIFLFYIIELVRKIPS